MSSTGPESHDLSASVNPSSGFRGTRRVRNFEVHVRSGAGAHFLLVETGQQKRGERGAFQIGARRKEAGKLFVAVYPHKGRDALIGSEGVLREASSRPQADVRRRSARKSPDFARMISEHDVDCMATYLIPGKRPWGRYD
jgi:hypothetical protein